MNAVCRAIRQGPPLKLMSNPVPDSIKKVAQTFEELQAARHLADYDLDENFDRVDVLERLQLADDAFAAWAAGRGSPDANVFLFALFLGKRWGRG